MKKLLEILSFYTTVPKIMIICYNVPEIWSMTDVIFSPFTSPNSLKNEDFKTMKISKKWKKNHLEISSFYASVPKIMITCYTVPKIWCVTDVIVIFLFGLFFAILPAWQPKQSKFQKTKKKTWRYYYQFRHVYQILWLDDVWCPRYGVGWTDNRRTDQ